VGEYVQKNILYHGESIPYVGILWGISAEFGEKSEISNTSLLRGKTCARTHCYDLVDVIE
jgi:hypothetical protein